MRDTGPVTVTVAVPDLVGSATEVALTVTCGGTGGRDGAVYRPVEEMLPQVVPVQERLQETEVFVVPVTFAVNCRW